MAPYFLFDQGVEVREVSGEMNSLLGTGKLTVAPIESEKPTQLQATVGGATATSSSSPVGTYIAVDGVATFDLVSSTTKPAFKAIDTRTYTFATSDYMTDYYVTFPPGTPAGVLDDFTRILTARVEGKDPGAASPPIGAALGGLASAAAGAASSAATAAAAAASAAMAKLGQPKAAPEAPSGTVQADQAGAEAEAVPHGEKGAPAADAGDASAAEKKNPVKQVTDLMGSLWNAGSGMVAKASEEIKKKAAQDTKTLQELGGRMGNKTQTHAQTTQDAVAAKADAAAQEAAQPTHT